MAEPTVDDLPAEADALEVIALELDRIEDDEVREPHRHAYHELIWVREGSGRHLIDGESVEFGPHTLTRDREGAGAPVRARGGDPRLRRALRRRVALRLAALAVLGAGMHAAHGARGRRAPLRCPARPAPRGAGAAARARVRGAASPPALRRAPVGATLARGPARGRGRHEHATSSSTESFLETLERDFTKSHEARHYAAELGVTTGTLSRTLTRLTGRTTKQLILERVLLEAARLLRFSDLSVKEIAARLGFKRPVRIQPRLQAPARRGAARLQEPRGLAAGAVPRPPLSTYDS